MQEEKRLCLFVRIMLRLQVLAKKLTISWFNLDNNINKKFDINPDEIKNPKRFI